LRGRLEPRRQSSLRKFLAQICSTALQEANAFAYRLTGLASADAQQAALDAGIDFYLPKPVKFADLKRLMDL